MPGKLSPALAVFFLLCAPLAEHPLAELPKPSQDAIVASYSVTKTSFGDADRILAPGQVYVVHIDGLLARNAIDRATPTNTITDGKLSAPPSRGVHFTLGTSAPGDDQQVQPGERFYLQKIEFKKDAVVFTLLSLKSEQVVRQNQSVASRLQLHLKFSSTGEQVAQLTPEALHRLTDTIFSPESTADSGPSNSPSSLHRGESSAEVRKALGEPESQIDLGQKVILVYKNLKVTLVDDKVTDAE